MTAAEHLSAEQFHLPGTEYVHWRELEPGQQTRSRNEMADLKHDIKQNGMHTPITLDAGGGIEDGHHRARVARALRMTRVPVRRTQ